ncbi:arsenate reductase (azurin) large subunit [Azospirillum sp. RWY-5-1]|uniref:Arsenate reductase (Azurin) large subunit n=1 Tax=Azospirillum oleiclasticum TaxID=2735135 RepID=A0ABX2TG90_9PROT|nr:arsenate reductase (azurin) large subunit [Azospirillum oleiclasticum]NYZ14822.1 arsenate reductase (azurin) large subunit [Azospirillum oleiclasticum]NYZ22192.1 arsenate reductase (azurin) large subunit [Azospirillum oleiclasticum]
MTYKRGIDQLPIPPKDARVQNVVCDFCIVGCGYKAISWPIDRQGGARPDQNVFGEDLAQQQGAESASWYSPSMYNVVSQNGKLVHLVIKPDKACEVNGGLSSVRGGRMGETRVSEQTGTMQARLGHPMVWRYSQMMPTSWEDSLALVADVTRRVIEEMGEDGVIVSAFDHGGAAGGYENTWGTGKLYFDAMKVKNIRIHNRPAYNSEVHASRDMGVGELNNCYEDAELADTIFVVGANPLENQTNYFLAHWVPNLRGDTLDKKRQLLAGEAHAAGRIIIVDPRRTVSVNACETVADRNNVLHLAINPGTDLVLLNALLTEVVARGWHAKDFIAQHTKGFDEAATANKVSIDDAASITGLPAADIRKAAQWIAEPKADGKRRRTMMAYEKGLIWGNDNYRTNAAMVNLALATHSIGREGTGCVRLGGHQEGYVRPSDAHVGRPAAYVDQLLIGGQGGVHHIWAVDHFKSTLNAEEFRRVYRRRTNMVKEAMDSVPYGDRAAQLEQIVAAIKRGGLFSVVVDILPTQIGEAAHVWLPAATAGEMNLTSMNGERRLRLTERYMDPPGEAMPDALIAARLGNAMEESFRRAGNETYAAQFKGKFGWKTEEDAFMDGYNQNAEGGRFVTYERLRAMGTNGVHEPVVGFENGRLIGTKRLYTDGKFKTDDGRAKFMKTEWRGLEVAGRAQQKEKYAFLINNGRNNLVWQNAFYDVHTPFVRERMPIAPIEMNPGDMAKLGLAAGDLVEVYNDVGSTQAMVYPTPTAKPGQAFMLFIAPTGQVGNVISKGTNEFMIPNYKNVWANIRRIGHTPGAEGMSFKSIEYPKDL